MQRIGETELRPFVPMTIEEWREAVEENQRARMADAAAIGSNPEGRSE